MLGVFHISPVTFTVQVKRHANTKKQKVKEKHKGSNTCIDQKIIKNVSAKVNSKL